MNEILRLIAGGLLALICCYIGVLIKRYYASREKFYRSACDFANVMISELSFKKTPLPEVVKKFSVDRKGVFENAINAYLICAKNNDDFEKMLKSIDMPLLKTEEKKDIINFFSNLGKTSLNEQLAIIGTAKEEFECKRLNCAEENKKLGGMYFKLCVLLGLALIVILA